MARGKHRKPKESRAGNRLAAGAVVIGTGVGTSIVTGGSAHAATLSQWEAIAQCESGNDWSINYSGDGLSVGGLQFQNASWRAALAYLNQHGYDTSSWTQNLYQGMPRDKVPTKEQTILAGEALLAIQGPGAWVCKGNGLSASMFEGGPAPYGPATTYGTPKPKPPPTRVRPHVTPPSKAGTYRVQPGDTLYDITKVRTGNAALDNWKPLYEANKAVIGDNPDLIYPGQVFTLPWESKKAGHTSRKPKPAPSPAPVAESEVLKLVNAERAKAGVGNLVADKALDDYATKWSKRQAAEGRMFHSGLDFPGSPKGENVAKGYESAEAVMKGWMSSPGHRANILDRDFTKMGVGRVGDYWTQVFAGGPTAPAPRESTAEYQLPVRAPITQKYGNRNPNYTLGYHTGVDFSAPFGTVVRAATGGVVVASDTSSAYGINVQIKNNDGTYTLYAHLSARTVSPGTKVAAGDQIGNVGSTGTSSGPHLHFEVRTRPQFAAGNFVDPADWLRAHGVTV
ncbi:peptidoglycan DD-metalloendopeptidase family protein [Streptomyces sp. NPDC048611]|uniref:peptidoglycan DD-metalloendopeptidase family protein n=1 Tax=Streptomyces sp. NPDC048611 TaxID=3155635 RepID=UPI0034166837